MLSKSGFVTKFICFSTLKVIFDGFYI